MSMMFSAPLQRAIFERLNGAEALSAVRGRIYDDAPHRSRENGSEPYVTIGDESVTPWNTSTEQGAVHRAVIRVYAPQRGFLPVKILAGLIAELLCTDPPAPDRGALISAEFTGAETRREENGALRRVDLSFRFVIEAVD